ncbi:MAG: hypothetical protein U5K37_10095 [Natrialbaceae archaeon]|nr:hypothetical protein [Natrialbaceae archaeon]
MVNPTVGWIAHQFHSVVFGFVFAGLLSLAPAAYRDQLVGFLAIGIGWALILWLFAAGLVSPVWLRLVGVEVPIPTIDFIRLATHTAWAIVLSITTWAGYRYAVPRIRDMLGR